MFAARLSQRISKQRFQSTMSRPIPSSQTTSPQAQAMQSYRWGDLCVDRRRITFGHGDRFLYDFCIFVGKCFPHNFRLTELSLWFAKRTYSIQLFTRHRFSRELSVDPADIEHSQAALISLRKDFHLVCSVLNRTCSSCFLRSRYHPSHELKKMHMDDKNEVCRSGYISDDKIRQWTQRWVLTSREMRVNIYRCFLLCDSYIYTRPLLNNYSNFFV